MSLWLAPLVFVCATLVAGLVSSSGDPSGGHRPPPSTADTTGRETPTGSGGGTPGGASDGSMGGGTGGETGGPTSEPEPTAAAPETSGSGSDWGSAAAIGAVAALITATGTAGARVITAMAHFRLAHASADAIRDGRLPATSLAGGDEPPADPPAPPGTS
jgi:hypothetical protein